MREGDKDDFVETLLEWHDANGRHDLPWREPTASPFDVLVAELMLQQTSAGQVLGVYGEFVKRYPTAGALLATDRRRDIDPTFATRSVLERRIGLRTVDDVTVRLHDVETRYCPEMELENPNR